LEARGVYSGTGGLELLTVAWLDTGSVFALDDIDLSICVLSALRASRFDVNVVMGLVVAAVVGYFEVDVGRCLLLGLGCGRSSFVTDVDVFSAARTVVMLLFAGDMNYLFALESAVLGRREVD
jgi:hypothetical protein